MTFSKIGRIMTALVASAALGLGMTACGGGTIGYLFVTSQFYNQVSAFKIDDYTGNLTPILHQPFTSGGTNPVTVLVRPGGGRYVYVINTGTAPTVGAAGTGLTPGTGAGISVFSVGGDGVLTYETTYQSKGFNPIWATFDSTGNFLYVLDRYSEYYNSANPATGAVNTNASITVFASAADTGRLTFQPNNAVLALTTHIPIDVFEVGQNPVMTKTSGSCLYTLSPTSIFPYVIGSNGQLTVATTGVFNVAGLPGGSSATNLTSINTSGNSSAAAYTYVTDAGTNQVFSLQAGSSTACALTSIVGSQMANLPGTSFPSNSFHERQRTGSLRSEPELDDLESDIEPCPKLYFGLLDRNRRDSFEARRSEQQPVPGWLGTRLRCAGPHQSISLCLQLY